MTITIKPATSARHPHRLVPLFAPPQAGFRAQGKEAAAAAEALAGVRGFTAAPGETLLLTEGGRQWLFAGLGGSKDVTRPGFSEAVGKGFTELRAAGARAISLTLPAGLPWPAEEAAGWAAEAMLLAGYTFESYRTIQVRAATVEVEVVAEGGQAGAKAGSSPAAALRRGLLGGQAVGEAVALTRDLINHPAAVANTDFMRGEARRVARATGGTYREIRGEALARQGYGAIHAVGRAAEHPPALVAIEWDGAARGAGTRGGRARGGNPRANGARRPTLALVGKGVVFDTGGLDLKTSSGMALMKKDMGGAAIVLGAYQALAALRLPLRLVCVLGLAENAVGPRAYHPGDILRSKAGPTIEITNTDAEGRVVLADAFALARSYRPDWMVDFATLTGAARIALGREVMALFCDDGPLREAVQGAAEATGEHVWPMPLWAPYRKKLESPVADLVNAADGFGGAITAALFLKEFAGDIAWAHLDCYGWSDGDHPLFPKGGGGHGVRLMVEAARRLLG